ncbi:AfsR/SARP family transcriptional regulator [Streptomyces stackebrandtii]|uniref:AfsR/SARP family transcriptional regulator n=1 Tax=Streptomyces stackebrandtii TaxID=3051177 RepID=UPI0028DB52DA|nr:BTAD domain-containing putative transcriptional regulator [Streptomyces sp. DSM 40976]
MWTVGAPGIGFSVFGRLRACRDGVELDLGSPQQRAVAAVLILRHGRTVSLDDLVAALWEAPPRRPESVVRTYVWRLRRLLEPGRTQGEAWQILRSVPGGYVLHLDEGSVDLELFERRVAEARGRSAAGETVAARELFDDALALSREPALTEVPGPFAQTERSRLEERRLDVVEARLEAMAELGESTEAATELAGLVETHPLREGLHYLLMRALSRSGRQAEALAVYRRVHSMLARELGIEPNARLQALHAEILAVTAPSVGRPEVVSGGDRAPRQIPHAVADFTGRAQETERIRQALRRPAAEGMPIVLLTGMGGAGKTSLVTHSVRPVLDAYPDGQLYVDLRGDGGTPADPGAVLASFLRALGERESFIPAELDGRVAGYRSRLAQQRMLIVLDNAADFDQVTPLLPDSPSCAVVITSRNALAALPVSLRVVLGPLPPQEAMHLFTRLVGSARIDAEPYTAHRVLSACGGLPLAVRILGSRLAARPEWTLEDLAERLADEQQRLSELRVEDVSVESSFALGYDQLDHEARRALRLLALPTHSLYDLPTASTLLGTPTGTTRQLLERLVAAGLLDEPALDRYRLHDLVRLFARRLAVETDSEQTRHAALGRLLDLHLLSATESYRVIRPGHTVVQASLPAAPGGPHFGSVGEALAWSASTLDDILMLLHQTAATHTARAATLLLMLDAVLMSSHLWHQVIPVAALVADVAAGTHDARSEARARYMLGGALASVGRPDQARANVARALELSNQEDDVYSMALNVQGLLPQIAPKASMEILRRAAELARKNGNSHLEAMTLGNAVQVRLVSEGIDDRTVADSERQVRLYRRLGDRFGEAFSYYRHGQVLARQNLLSDAIAIHLRSLDMLAVGEQDLVRAGNHVRLCEAYTQTGGLALAVRHAEEGLLLSRQIRHEQLEAVSLRALGDAKSAMNRPEEAREHWQLALSIFESVRLDALADGVRERLRAGSQGTPPPTAA